MEAEVVTVGSELLLGQIVDTNSAVIARQLASIGVNLFYKTTVGDNLSRVSAVIRQALDRSTVVITTGGLGPTADDITREAVADATGRTLVFSEPLMAQIEAFFASRGLRVSPSNRRQAHIPAGAIPIENPVGTAPGFIVEEGERTVISLPGVPREMDYLLVNRVVPYLRDRYRIAGEIRLRVVKTVGLGESRIGEALADFMERGANPTVGTLAHLGQVDVRIAAKAEDAEAAERLIAPVEAEVRQRLGDVVFGVDGDTLEGEIVARLRSAGNRLAVAEVGTAGAAIERLAAGAPEVFTAGFVFAELAAARKSGLEVVDGATAEESARNLAAAVARWAATEVGAATYLEEVPDASPPVVRAGFAVAVGGRLESREARLGGDAASIRIRAATILLDVVRRAVPRAASAAQSQGVA